MTNAWELLYSPQLGCFRHINSSFSKLTFEGIEMKSLSEAASAIRSVCGLLARTMQRKDAGARNHQGREIEVLRRGPKNNLSVFAIRGAMIALRREEAEKILVT